MNNAEKQHPDFTKFMYREADGWIKKCVDYVFIATNAYYQLNGVAIQAVMDPEDLEKDGLLNNELGNPNA